MSHQSGRLQIWQPSRKIVAKNLKTLRSTSGNDFENVHFCSKNSFPQNIPLERKNVVWQPGRKIAAKTPKIFSNDQTTVCWVQNFWKKEFFKKVQFISNCPSGHVESNFDFRQPYWNCSRECDDFLLKEQRRQKLWTFAGKTLFSSKCSTAQVKCSFHSPAEKSSVEHWKAFAHLIFCRSEKFLSLRSICRNKSLNFSKKLFFNFFSWPVECDFDDFNEAVQRIGIPIKIVILLQKSQVEMFRWTPRMQLRQRC